MFSSRITKAGGLVTGGGDVFRDEHSLSFGGDNDYLSCESNFESILFNAPFSMVFWLKADDGRPSAIEYLVGTKSGEDNIWARIETDGDIQFYYKEGSTESNVTASAYFADGPSGWVELAFTLSDSAQVIYANGVAIASGATSISTSGFAQDTNRDCVIAARNNQGTPDGHFAGEISDFAFYNTALSASQIATIYNGGEPYNHNEGSAAKSLLAWYRMGDGSENGANISYVYDMSLNSNDGVPKNMTVTAYSGDTP